MTDLSQSFPRKIHFKCISDNDNHQVSNLFKFVLLTRYIIKTYFLTKKNIIYFKIIKIYNNNSFNVKVRLKHFICKMKKQQNFPLNLTSAFYQSPFSLTSKLTTGRLLSHPFKTLAHVPPTEYPRPILISIRCTYNLLQFSGLRFVKRLMDTSVYSFDAGLTDVSYTNGRQRAWRSRG